jgi:dihydroflavonol-4-reductase
MRAFVTGATGFVGAHLARALRERGDETRCLVRPTSRRHHLDSLGVDCRVGDLADLDGLRGAIDGCDLVFHCAADYRFSVTDPTDVYRCNVDGTRNVFAAAAEVGVGRVVYTSSVATLGVNRDGTPADESTPSSLRAMIGPYKRSKYLAERVADEWVAEHKLPLVVVNPSTPIGELDARPTPTGQFLIDFLARRMPAYVDTGLNLVDVRDVAQGHLLAAERGVIGQRYILGHRNFGLQDLLDLLASVAGVEWARIRLPHWVPLVLAALEAPLARLRRRAPRISLEAVRLSRKKMFFDSGKAVRELGFPQSPIEPALRRAVEWFRGNGYVPS